MKLRLAVCLALFAATAHAQELVKDDDPIHQVIKFSLPDNEDFAEVEMGREFKVYRQVGGLTTGPDPIDLIYLHDEKNERTMFGIVSEDRGREMFFMLGFYDKKNRISVCAGEKAANLISAEFIKDRVAGINKSK